MSHIPIASDHAGLPLKRELKAALEAEGYVVLDLGTHAAESVDYPDFAEKVADLVAAGDASRGILVCGTGIGMAISANRRVGVRAAVLHDSTEARLTRAHNDANIACFGCRTIGVETAMDALRVFLATPFEGGRHARRVGKIDGPRP